MKKIALLILAATAPDTLAILADILGKNFSIYVHLDRKSDLGAYRARCSRSDITFIPRRFEVFWAGFSMIEATMALLEYASQDADFSHYCLLSDDSLPLFGPENLIQKITTSAEWIQTWKVPKDHLFQERYKRFFHLDSRFSTARWMLTEQRSFEPSDFRSLLELEYVRQRGKFPLTDLYCGKQWWVLCQASVADILRFHHSNEHFRLSFKYSAVSDEIYLQTIYRIVKPEAPVSGNPVYDDFTREPKPYTFSSIDEILTFKNFRESCSRYLFMRKIKLKSSISPEEVRQRLLMEPHYEASDETV